MWATRILTLGTALLTVACGGGGDGGTPTSPTPQQLPQGNIQLDGNARLKDCVRGTVSARCDFEETGRNIGPGCAGQLRITVRFLAEETEIAVDRWSAGAQVFLPNQEFAYTARISGPADAIASINRFTRQVEFATVRCPS
jgi:hypothetical protein